MTKIMTLAIILISFNSFANGPIVQGLDNEVLNKLKVNLWAKGLNSPIIQEDLIHNPLVLATEHALSSEEFISEREPSHQNESLKKETQFAYTEELMAAISFVDNQ